MTDSNPKGLALLLLKKHGVDTMKEHAEDHEDGTDMPEGMLEAAQDLLDAVKSDDAKAVAEALHNAYSICDADEDKSEEPEPAEDME